VDDGPDVGAESMDGPGTDSEAEESVDEGGGEVENQR